jgi:hypothetical protein
VRARPGGCKCSDVYPCPLDSLYTLNFQHFDVSPLADFLTLYPVFTLSSNFPLIAITLRNNLQILWNYLRPERHARASGCGALHGPCLTRRGRRQRERCPQ